MTSSIPPDTTSAYRENLRREMLEKRARVPEDLHQRWSTEVADHLGRLLDRLAPRVVGFCWPWRGEFDARSVVANWLSADAMRRAALPVIETAHAPMRFRAWGPHTEMTTGHFGISIPADGDWVVPNVLLLPVVAFDLSGFRLGYGGGYFDRTLAAISPRPVAVGVGFALQEAPSIAPQSWDEPLDWMVTELGVRAVGG